MESLRRDGKIEGVLLRTPVFEGSGTYLNLRIGSKLAPGGCGEVLAQLDAEDAIAPTGERRRGMATPDSATTSSKSASG